MTEVARVWSLQELRAHHVSGGRLYKEVLRVEALSAGIYRLDRDTADPQTPHREDELYVVLAGKGSVEIGGKRDEISPGALIYVPSEVEHRFVDVVEDLELLVVFAPPEST